MGKEPILHPNSEANSTILVTGPIGIISLLAKLIFCLNYGSLLELWLYYWNCGYTIEKVAHYWNGSYTIGMVAILLK